MRASGTFGEQLLQSFSAETLEELSLLLQLLLLDTLLDLLLLLRESDKLDNETDTDRLLSESEMLCEDCD